MSDGPVMALLSDLAGSEGGKRFLLNLLGALEANHLAVELVRRLLGDIAGAQSPGNPLYPFHPMLEVLREVIFDTPDDYQFQGPPPASSEGIWMTVKSAENLAGMLRSDPAVPAARLRDILIGIDTYGPWNGLPDEALLRIEEAVNDPASDFGFVLARRIPRKRFASSGAPDLRPAPAWFSRWCEFTKGHPGLTAPSGELAGRLRDWLGLAHFGEATPLFVLRTNGPCGVDEIVAHRPTVFEGFDNPMYKHRAADEFNRHLYGSAADIVLARRPPAVPDRLDGGPELVSRGVRFASRRFTCVYVGRTPALDFDPFAEFHPRLLPDGLAVTDVPREIHRRLYAAA